MFAQFHDATIQTANKASSSSVAFSQRMTSMACNDAVIHVGYNIIMSEAVVIDFNIVSSSSRITEALPSGVVVKN